MLLDGKVMCIVEKWKLECSSNPAETKDAKSLGITEYAIDSTKKLKVTEFSDSETDSTSSHTVADLFGDAKTNTDETSLLEVPKEELSNPSSGIKTNIDSIATDLLKNWNNLKEVFRIPRLEQQKRKEDELEVDNRAKEQDKVKQQQQTSFSSAYNEVGFKCGDQIQVVISTNHHRDKSYDYESPGTNLDSGTRRFNQSRPLSKPIRNPHLAYPALADSNESKHSRKEEEALPPSVCIPDMSPHQMPPDNFSRPVYSELTFAPPAVESAPPPVVYPPQIMFPPSQMPFMGSTPSMLPHNPAVMPPPTSVASQHPPPHMQQPPLQAGQIPMCQTGPVGAPPPCPNNFLLPQNVPPPSVVPPNQVQHPPIQGYPPGVYSNQGQQQQPMYFIPQQQVNNPPPTSFPESIPIPQSSSTATFPVQTLIPVIKEEPVPKPVRLPKNWRTATDSEGNVYYYHSITRQTQWDPPSENEDESEDEEEDSSSEESESSDTPTYDEPKVKSTKHSRKKSKKRKPTKAAADTSVVPVRPEIAKKIKELFRTKISSFIVHCLNAYRKPSCNIGRITSNEDFKYLARKVLVSNESSSKRCSERESNSSNITHRHESNDLSMPVCFLVKEQAKSLVVIQDLQKRVESIENIQDDVIDSLAEIRKFLCNESKTYSGLNLESSSLLASNEAPSIHASESQSFTKSHRFAYSPSTKCISLKDCSPLKSSTSLQASEHSEKQFESKTKDCQLESDKQDSGLDSDHLSLNKPSNNWGKQESGDELLQLLDEISERTEVLQKQLSVIDQKSISDLSPHHMNRAVKIRSKVDLKENAKTHTSCLNCSKRTSTSVRSLCVDDNMAKTSSDEPPECFSGRMLSDHVHRREKRTGNKIDSAMVSSILKETNVVDLQRQVLIYLVENAVLHTKLNELEQVVASKSLENNKIENSLKDETRLLMMENRELRISLDEQKLETNMLRSKVMMMERVLQSVSVENRELTWQLGESLGIQNLSRKEPRQFSSSYTFGNPTTSKLMRRPSLPSQFKESNINCVKSKLLSNTSSCLDVTVEEPELPWPAVCSPAPLEKQSGAVQSSTPMAPLFTKLKDVKAGISSPASSASNFQSVKKRIKTAEKDTMFKNFISETDPEEDLQDTRYETCVSHLKLNASNLEDSTTQFPFNTILEKLKANSDYRLSRRTQMNDMNFSTDHAKPTSTQNKFVTSHEAVPTENLRHARNHPPNKKGKNIHQRIQDILDRIMSESEEAS